jgi:hypothetical protein
LFSPHHRDVCSAQPAAWEFGTIELERARQHLSDTRISKALLIKRVEVILHAFYGHELAIFDALRFQHL